MTTHPILDQHEIIAWDMDETLVNGHNSAFFRAYIRANPRKRHHIITFRTPRAWAEQSLLELEVYGVPPRLIEAVHSVPDELYEAFSEHRVSCASIEEIGRSPDTPAKVRQYLAFKALTAKRIGATLLVDDMAALVEADCVANGVVFLNAIGKFPRVPSDDPLGMDAF